MEKSKALEFLKQCLNEVPKLRKLHHGNQDIELWLDKVQEIIKAGLDPDDCKKLWVSRPVSNIGSAQVRQSEYLVRLMGHETGLKRVIQKYEMLGVKGEAEKDKGGKVEMDKKKILAFLNEKMQEVYELETLPPNNANFPRWCNTIEGFLYKVFGKDSWEYETFKEAGILRGFVDDEHTQYRKSVKSRDIALASIIDTIESTKYKEPASTTEPPKAFIAHGGETQARNKLQRFLIALGVTPSIIEEEPKEGRSPNEQVEYYLEQADCAIVLGTADDKELKDGKLYPRRNVYIEIGRMQERFPKRIIFLLEEGASFPSNISEKLYTRFTQENMDEAFITTARELQAFGLLKAVKPQE